MNKKFEHSPQPKTQPRTGRHHPALNSGCQPGFRGHTLTTIAAKLAMRSWSNVSNRL
jgi:hypothetical protein